MMRTHRGRRERVLSARWIIPADGVPINGGSIRVSDDRVVEIRSGSAPAEAEDLGDVALLPGLVNAHTHLEFSDLEQPIGETGVPLSSWIGQVVAARGEATPESTQSAIDRGRRELAESGTVLAGEITTPPSSSSPGALPELVRFAEVLGLEADRFGERLEAAKLHLLSDSLGAISPHAPYSTAIDAIEACVELSRTFRRPLAMHVAESPDERELMYSGTGSFSDALRELGVWRDDLFPWGGDAFATLIDLLSGAPHVLLIHGNDLTDDEIERLSRHDNFTVVYCPRTHHFFRHAEHPVNRMLAAGIRVALGTDSRASNPDLSVWKEMQFLLKHRPDLPPADILKMATINGADALGKSDIGRIAVGCRAKLGFIPSAAKNESELYEDFSRTHFALLPATDEDG